MNQSTNQKEQTGKIRTTHDKTLLLVQNAILSAIIILMAFTPLGYLRVGPVSITFLIIPVAIGAIINGPLSGAILGGVFGATSFAQCFGLDPFGTALLAINPFLTFIMTMVPRIIMGLAVGLIFKALYNRNSKSIIPYGLASLSGALINTVLFVGSLILFFGNSDYLRQFGDSILAIIGVLVTFNALIEAVVSTVIGSVIAKTVKKIVSARV
ncbi:MAG: ECF transporter S component [Clostridiaceae bacterium]|nr:ECF transporter S component [Clostridiaceae bacterium]